MDIEKEDPVILARKQVLRKLQYAITIAEAVKTKGTEKSKNGREDIVTCIPQFYSQYWTEITSFLDDDFQRSWSILRNDKVLKSFIERHPFEITIAGYIPSPARLVDHTNLYYRTNLSDTYLQEIGYFISTLPKPISCANLVSVFDHYMFSAPDIQQQVIEMVPQEPVIPVEKKRGPRPNCQIYHKSTFSWVLVACFVSLI